MSRYRDPQLGHNFIIHYTQIQWKFSCRSWWHWPNIEAVPGQRIVLKWLCIGCSDFHIDTIWKQNQSVTSARNCRSDAPECVVLFRHVSSVSPFRVDLGRNSKDFLFSNRKSLHGIKNNCPTTIRSRKLISAAKTYRSITLAFNPLTAKLFNLNFYTLGVVSRWRDPQLQVSENYSDLTKWRSTVSNYCWLMSYFIFTMFKRWWLFC